MNTLVDVILKKIKFYGNRKKLQLLNYFKEKSSTIYSLNEKVYYKNYKTYFFGIVRVFTEHLEHPEDTPLATI